MKVNGETSTICKAAVWADIPSCGLGNKLLIWGKALAFARLHGLPLTVSGWNNRNGLRTWLKGGGWRRYNQDFNSPGWMSQLKWQMQMRQSRIIDEPVGQVTTEPNHIYRFHKMTHWSDYFGELKPIREAVIQELPNLLSDDCRSTVEAVKPIDMAVHIRMGDFRPLKPGEKFAEVGHVRTPLEYFIQIIENVRKLLNKPVHVTVFSDGKDSDLQSILSLPNLERAEPAAAIVDIYRMANCKLLVCAAGSTFSYWSVFLGEQPAIIHRDHIHQSIRPSAMGNTIFEGAVPEELEQWPALLCSNLREIDW